LLNIAGGDRYKRSEIERLRPLLKQTETRVIVQDYYEILQVHPKADRAVIEAAYKKVLQIRKSGILNGMRLEEALSQLEEARSVLLDPLKRMAYDAKRNGFTKLDKAPAEQPSKPTPAAASAAPKSTPPSIRTVLNRYVDERTMIRLDTIHDVHQRNPKQELAVIVAIVLLVNLIIFFVVRVAYNEKTISGALFAFLIFVQLSFLSATFYFIGLRYSKKQRFRTELEATLHIRYNLDSTQTTAWGKVLISASDFNGSLACPKNMSMNAIHDRKRVNTSPLLVKFISCDAKSISVDCGHTILHFYPECIIVEKMRNFSLQRYSNVELTHNEEAVYMRDRVVGKAYVHQRKDGGPDLRHKHNPTYNIYEKDYDTLPILWIRGTCFDLKIICMNSHVALAFSESIALWRKMCS
jgi:hypothetical protein